MHLLKSWISIEKLTCLIAAFADGIQRIVKMIQGRVICSLISKAPSVVVSEFEIGVLCIVLEFKQLVRLCAPYLQGQTLQPLFCDHSVGL
jgi:hypothetical protein